MKIAEQEYRNVPLDELKLHPRNPRKGNVTAIRESIDANDFVGAVIAQKSTGYVLAGNHRLMAAKESGATEIPAVIVDVDDEAALRILVADNRTSDLAEYDDSELVALLREVGRDDGTLEGTGWEFDDFRKLEAQIEKLARAEGLPSSDEPQPTPEYRCPKCHHEWAGARKPETL